MRPSILAVAALLTSTMAAGCITTSQPLAGDGLPRAFDTSRGWSVPLTPELYEMLEGVKALVPAADGVELSIGVFHPSIPGCDWAAAELPAACKLPTVMDGGPYYGDRVAIDKYRPPTIEWLVPRGYAVIQMALRGTGESGGCMEYKSLRDVEDVSAVIDWVAAQAWSNGNVGMIGRSYDGTTAWAGAASGNAHLKAIVPISGAVDAPLLYFKNGTAEGRTLTPHIPTYWAPYGLGLEDRADPTSRAPQWQENLCPEVLESHTESNAAIVEGAGSDYWQQRNLRPAIAANYKGAVWVIHGLQDWNVNPSQAVPFINELQDAGIPTRAWLGVWGHAYPDRVDEHRNVRWDWAQQVLGWFDFYLRGQGAQPWLGVEVEDSLFVWRAEQSYPPRDASLTPWELGPEGALSREPASGEGSARLVGGDPTALPAQAAPVPASALGLGLPMSSATFTSEPLPEAVRIAGLPQLQVTATPSTPVGGDLFAELFDVYPDGRSVRLSWAAINLRFHAGGNTEASTLTPGSPVQAMMEFEPTDALVARGHALRLVLHRDGVEDILASPSMEPLDIALGGEASVLRLPLVERPTIVPTYAAPGLAP